MLKAEATERVGFAVSVMTYQEVPVGVLGSVCHSHSKLAMLTGEASG